MRQHNEPIEGAKCKGQDVFQYQLHVMLRYDDDQMYEYAEDGQRFLVPVEERKHYADRIRAVLLIWQTIQ